MSEIPRVLPDLPLWLSSKARRQAQNRRSATQERKRAIATGGRVQPGSGSSWRARGDVKTEIYLDQMKYTDADSYRLTVKEWRQYRHDANNQGRVPGFIIEFANHGIRLRVTEEG